MVRHRVFVLIVDLYFEEFLDALGRPHFDRIRYEFFDEQGPAVAALRADEIDILLDSAGLSQDSQDLLLATPGVNLLTSATSRLRFLAVNRARPPLADPALRAVLGCLVEGDLLAGESLTDKVTALNRLAASDVWGIPGVSQSCAATTEAARLEHIIQTLHAGGYSWNREPAVGQRGNGLLGADGAALPELTILAPQTDALRMGLAEALAEAASAIGLRITVRDSQAADITYGLFSSGQYDLALVGLRQVGPPDYLCDWYGEMGSLDPGILEVHRLCQAVLAETDPQVARPQYERLQLLVLEENILIPVYSELAADAFRNVFFPFETALDGLSGIFGAPSLALPLP